MRGSFAEGRKDTYRCLGCDLKVAPDDDTVCSHHPAEAEHIGIADARQNYAEVWRFPCCGEVVLESYARSPGCVQSRHRPDGLQVEALATLRRRSPEYWNSWRAAHPEVVPDFEGLDLLGFSGVGLNLAGVNLRRPTSMAPTLRGSTCGAPS